MKKNFLKFFGIFFLAILICGCFENKMTAEKNSKTQPEIDLVEEKLKTMSIEEKIGQMMLIGVHGQKIDENIKFMLNAYHVGGIIYYDRNMETLEQVKNLSAELQANSKIPLFIALDEEGGRVSRMKHALPPPPSQEIIGQSGDYNLAKTQAIEIAKKLREIGINLNFAPVADVGKNERMFSTDSKIVAEFLSSAAKGYESENFFYTLKHFPGIGKSKIDPHKDISVIDDSKETLMQEDILPFQKIISEQDNSKFMIMIGHLKYAALDGKNPATLSPAIITKLLREELNFKGVIVTDDLEMGAVSNYDDSEIGVQAVKAGADILLVCHKYEEQKKVCDGVLEAFKRGEISEERINESVRRILKMKQKFFSAN